MENKIKHKILLVDDNPVFRKALEMQLNTILENQIETIDNAFNGEEAIRKVSSTFYDLVFMDIEMPVMNGIEATKYINTNYPEIKIIGISFNDSISKRRQMMEAGSFRFFLKTELDEEMIMEVFNLIRK